MRNGTNKKAVSKRKEVYKKKPQILNGKPSIINVGPRERNMLKEAIDEGAYLAAIYGVPRNDKGE